MRPEYSVFRTRTPPEGQYSYSIGWTIEYEYEYHFIEYEYEIWPEMWVKMRALPRFSTNVEAEPRRQSVPRQSPNPVKCFSLLKTAFCAAKVVKTFGWCL